MYWNRLLEKTIKKAKETFPAIIITGPRQSGKSTLLNYLFKDKASFLYMDDPDFRNLLKENSYEYLKKLKKPVVIDEIQYMPELTQTIKLLIDKDRTPGNWFITGSQQFNVMRNISESLAGRIAVLSLPTFQLRERKDICDIGEYLLLGTYPELCVNKGIDTRLWYSSYLQTYLERDIRNLANIENLGDFETFIRYIATLTAQQLNYSHISNEIGISVPTVKRWISVLESSYLVFLLPPFFRNYGKRIIKAPKLYFFDVGLVNYLVNIRDKDFLLSGPMSGSIFETAVISEIYKEQYAKGIKPELYYWRSQSGVEVDLIKPENNRYAGYEIKLANRIKPRFYKNLKYWLNLDKNFNAKTYLITNCNEQLPLPENITNIYWKNL